MKAKLKDIYLNIIMIFIRRLMSLVTENKVLIKEKIEKASLYGKEYFKTTE